MQGIGKRKFGFWFAHLAMLVALLLAAMPSAYSAAKTILVLGDSLSAEYGLQRGAGWVPLLERKLQAAGYKATVINASVSGETTSGGKTRLPALLKQHQPGLVIIELGGNDGLRGLDLKSTEANLRAIIKDASAAKARVLLVGMQIPPNYGPDYTEKFTALYPRLAKELHTALVPFLLEKVAQDPALFQADRIHPTAAAQPLMLDTVWPVLQPLLK